MFRKILLSAVIAVSVFATGAAVYARTETSYGREADAIFQLQSDRDESKTFDREYVVSGSAKEGTEITIELYWFSQEDEKTIVANKKKSGDSEKNGQWILQQNEKLVVGASGIFAEPVYLNFGKNKIVIYAKDIKGKTDNKTLMLERFLEDQANKDINGNTFNKFKEDMSSTMNTDE